MIDVQRLRRYLPASIGLLAAVGAAFTLGRSGVAPASVLVPFAAAVVCTEVIRRTAAQIDRTGAASNGRVRVTSVRQVREGDVLEGYEGLGPVTAVRHRGLRSHVFTENVGLIFNRFERLGVLAGSEQPWPSA